MGGGDEKQNDQCQLTGKGKLTNKPISNKQLIPTERRELEKILFCTGDSKGIKSSGLPAFTKASKHLVSQCV